MNFMKLYTKAGAIDWKWLIKTYGVPVAFAIIQAIQGVKTTQEHQKMWEYFEAHIKNQSGKS